MIVLFSATFGNSDLNKTFKETKKRAGLSSRPAFDEKCGKEKGCIALPDQLFPLLSLQGQNVLLGGCDSKRDASGCDGWGTAMPRAFDSGDAKASLTAVQKRRRRRCRSSGGSGAEATAAAMQKRRRRRCRSGGGAEAAAMAVQKQRQRRCTRVDGSSGGGVCRGPGVEKMRGIKGKSTQYSFYLNLRTESKREL
ncbi:unnamed protein product [Cuscuta campestris]|uniref:Uncharacterized protein n=1 Tax=Cuscuta campestris TaxID=132261 RepID=A0A484MK56_9ASTE|nr:unnamed protein product [Cuscuta campestris]